MTSKISSPLPTHKGELCYLSNVVSDHTELGCRPTGPRKIGLSVNDFASCELVICPMQWISDSKRRNARRRKKITKSLIYWDIIIP